MKLYHITRNLGHDGNFVPTIPKSKGNQEDGEIKRICFSTSIEGCLSSVAYGGQFISDLCGEFWEDSSKIKNQILKVFSINTEEYNITDDAIIYPDTLYREHRVDDAEDTKEHWVTVPVSVRPEDSFLITLQDYEAEEVYVPSYEMMKLGEEKYEGGFIEAYAEELGIGEMGIPDSMIIYDAKYKKLRVRKGETVTFYVENEEKALIETFIDHGVQFALCETISYKNSTGCVLYFTSGKGVLKALAGYSAKTSRMVSVLEPNPYWGEYGEAV